MKNSIAHICIKVVISILFLCVAIGGTWYCIISKLHPAVIFSLSSIIWIVVLLILSTIWNILEDND